MDKRSQSIQGKEIAEKRRLMFERHGGLLCPKDLARELGYAHYEDAERWARERGIPAVPLGQRKRGYEVDLVAKAIVQGRGMV